MSGMSVDELAAHWRVSAKTVRRLIVSGALGYLSVADRIIIRPVDLSDYEARHAKPAGRAKAIAKRIFEDG